MHRLIRIFIAMVSNVAAAQALDVNGNYPLPYLDSQGQLRTYLLIPSNKVQPSIKFTPSGQGNYTYTYQLSNATTSPPSIEHLEIAVMESKEVPDPALEPPMGFASTLEPIDNNLVIRLRAIPRRNILARSNPIPAESDVVFEISSPALAGIGKVRVFGTPPDITCDSGVCVAIIGENEVTIR